MSLTNKLKFLTQISILGSTLFYSQAKAEDIIYKHKEKPPIKLEIPIDQPKQEKPPDNDWKPLPYSPEELKFEENPSTDITFNAEESQRRIRLGYQIDNIFLGTNYQFLNLQDHNLNLLSRLNLNEKITLEAEANLEEKIRASLLNKIQKDSYLILNLETNQNNDLNTCLAYTKQLTKELGLILCLKSKNSEFNEARLILTKKDIKTDLFRDNDVDNSLKKIENISKGHLANLDIKINSLTGESTFDTGLEIAYFHNNKLNIYTPINLGDYYIINDLTLAHEISLNLETKSFILTPSLTGKFMDTGLVFHYQFALENNNNPENAFFIGFNKQF